MKHEEAKQIKRELSKEDSYNIQVVPYCGEYEVMIEEKNQSERAMCLFPEVIRVIAAHEKGCVISTIGNGYHGMRLTLI